MLHNGSDGDTDFYARCATSQSSPGRPSVLELGCGWGRVSWRVWQEGADLLGVDAEPQFLAMARAREEELAATGRALPRWIEGDLLQVELSEQFDFVLLPYNTLWAVGGRDGVVQALKQARRYLKPEGQVWFDVYPLDEFHGAALRGEVETADQPAEELLELPSPFGPLTITEETKIELTTQQLDVTHRAYLSDRSLVGESHLVHYYLTFSEVLACIEEADLDVYGLFGSFDGDHFDDESEHLIVVAGIAAPETDRA